MKDFYQYFKEFYGERGIQPLLENHIFCDSDGNNADIDLKMLFDEALEIRLNQVKIPFDGDSFDRELLRDIIKIMNPNRVIDSDIEHKEILINIINKEVTQWKTLHTNYTSQENRNTGRTRRGQLPRI